MSLPLPPLLHRTLRPGLLLELEVLDRAAASRAMRRWDRGRGPGARLLLLGLGWRAPPRLLLRRLGLRMSAHAPGLTRCCCPDSI